MKWINLPMTSNKMEFLQKTGVPHTLYVTNNSTTIKLINEPITYFMAPSFMKKKDLSFVQKVKRAAQASGLPDQKVSAADISYFRFNQVEQSENVVEVDVNHAYWNIARQLGVINDKVFKEGEEVEKMTRLIGLGSLASKKKVFQFDGKNYHWIGYKYDQVLRSYFFRVSLELDLIMRSIFSDIQQDSFFYWFDAFFVTPQVAEYISEEVKRFDLSVKTKPIRSIERIRDAQGYEYIKVADKDKEGKGRIRTFFLPDQARTLSGLSSYQI